MEAANCDLNPGRAQAASQIHGSRKLIGLHTQETNKRLAAIALDHVDDFVQRDSFVGLVVGV